MSGRTNLRADRFRGNLMLVNAAYPCLVPEKSIDLVPVCGGEGGVLLAREAAVQLEALMKELDGWRHILPVSGWRSRQEQQEIWDSTLRERGETYTHQFVALPGHSEHETGLAIDLALRQKVVDFICPDFPETGICQTFRELAPKYGFVQRYRAGKESITGIAPEPWHFRYVGTPHAQRMEEQGLCLEEYVDCCMPAPGRERP